MLRTIAEARCALASRLLRHAKLEREDEAIITMWLLGSGPHPMHAIISMWRQLFPAAAIKFDQAHDVDACPRETINSHQNIFRKHDSHFGPGKDGWSLRSDESSQGFVDAWVAPKSAVQ